MKTFRVVSFFAARCDARVQHAPRIWPIKARFDNHTAAIFRRHNMNSIGYWVPEEAAL